MSKNIFSLIDQLVSMSGSTSSFDTLDSELTLIEEEIPKLKNEINELESSMNDDKYFDASQEIVDRNIELSVSKKLSKLEKEFDILKERQKNLQDEEKQYIEAIDLLKQKIVKAKRTISIIETRLKKTNDSNTKTIYNEIFAEESEKISLLQKRLEEKNVLYENIAKEVDELNVKVDKVKKDIEQSTSRLLEVRRNLNSKSNYIDESLKNKDNENIKSLQKRLIDLEAKKLTILTDATYINSEIKELFIAEKNDMAMQKLLELVTIVNSMPYMDINDVQSLEQELLKLEDQQNNLINIIESKEYYGNDVKYLNNRINHLKKLIQVKNDEIKATRERISQIDNVLVLDVTNELKNAENESEMLEKSLTDYEQLIKSTERKNSNTLVALQASYNKKTNELKIIREIIERYSKELGILIEISSGLEEEKISKLNDEIENYKREIDDLTKLKLLSTKTKDTIEQESDKQKLKELSDNINSLRQRLKFGKTPQEIFDEIEMYISSSEATADENMDEFSLESIDDEKEFDSTNEKVDLSEINIEENNINDFSLIEDHPNETNEQEVEIQEETFDFPELQERINVLENETKDSNDSDEEEYTFSELEDTDYFSLDEFLKNLEEQNED